MTKPEPTGETIGPRLKINAERRAQIGAERRARTRKVLLESAFEALGNERGRHIRIEDVCSIAGISRANFYNYFSDLEDLLGALTYELSHDFNIAMLSVIEAITSSSERTAAAIRFHVDRANKDPRWGWAMVHVSAGGPILGAESYRQATKTVLEGQASGEFPECPTNVAVDLILGATLAAMMRTLRDPQTATFPEETARHILLGLGISRSEASRIVAMELPDPMEELGKLLEGKA
jgi:AcrR family transcriptional regulator